MSHPTRPTRPRKPVAPGTDPVELERLALQERTHPEFEPLVVQSVLWIVRAYNAVLHAQAEELRPLGLSPSGFNALMALNNTVDGTLEPCQLAQRLLISRPSMSGLLDTLERKSLIRRRPHPQDRRRVLVALTDEGRRLLDDHFPQHYRRQNAQLADLDEEELAQLVYLLRRIQGAVPAQPSEPEEPPQARSA